MMQIWAWFSNIFAQLLKSTTKDTQVKSFNKPVDLSQQDMFREMTLARVAILKVIARSTYDEPSFFIWSSS